MDYKLYILVSWHVEQTSLLKILPFLASSWVLQNIRSLKYCREWQHNGNLIGFGKIELRLHCDSIPMSNYYHKHNRNSTATVPILPFRKKSLNWFHARHQRRISSLYPICIFLITFIVLPAHSWLIPFPSFSIVNIYSRDPFFYRKPHTTTKRRWLQHDDSNDNDVDTGASSSAIDKENVIGAAKYIQDSNDEVGSSIPDSSDVSSFASSGMESANGNESTYNDNMTDRFKYKVRVSKWTRILAFRKTYWSIFHSLFFFAI